jgi:hypothetical protein
MKDMQIRMMIPTGWMHRNIRDDRCVALACLINVMCHMAVCG